MKVILFHLKTVPTEITFGKGTLGLKGTWFYLFIRNEPKWFRGIGNIYENPELI
jgi:hypothetical protein